MVKAQKYVVIKHFEGNPKRSDYKIVTYELPLLKEHDILIKVEWVSLDPYQRGYGKTDQLPYDQFGYQVGIVQESKNENYLIGTRVVSHYGWCDYCVMNPDLIITGTYGIPHTAAYKLPDCLLGLSPSLGVGAAGLSGAAAYFGVWHICNPIPGSTMVVTTAAGAVGSLVGQIAKIAGCKVIGFTGRDDKVQWLTKELGFHHAFNYKTVDVTKALQKAAPNGVDWYFDNVGGELSYTIMKQMKSHGRVAICGCISAHNQSGTTSHHIIQSIILEKQLKVEGFLTYRWIIQWPEAFELLTDWIRTGKLKAREHVTEGFDNIADAFLGMLSGDNCGKAVVKVS